MLTGSVVMVYCLDLKFSKELGTQFRTFPTSFSKNVKTVVFRNTFKWQYRRSKLSKHTELVLHIV